MKRRQFLVTLVGTSFIPATTLTFSRSTAVKRGDRVVFRDGSIWAFDPTKEQGWAWCDDTPLPFVLRTAVRWLPPDTPFEVRQAIPQWGEKVGRLAWYYSPYMQYRYEGDFYGSKFEKYGGYWLRYRGRA